MNQPRLPILLATLVVCLLVGLDPLWGQHIRLDSRPDCQESSLDLANLPAGRLFAVWQQGAEASPGSPPRVYARIFDVNGAALAPEFPLTGENAVGPVVAASLEGELLVVWGDAALGRLMARRFFANGTAAGPEIVVSSIFPSGGWAVTRTPNGYAVVAIQGSEVRLWRLGNTGSATGPTEVVASITGIPEDPTPIVRDPAVAYGPAGLVVAWAEEHFGGASIGAVVRTATASLPLPLSAELQPADDPQPIEPAVAVDGQGRILLAWNESPLQEGTLRAQIFGPDLVAAGPPFQVEDPGFPSLAFSAPDAAGLSDGFVVAWQFVPAYSGDAPHITLMRRIHGNGLVLGRATYLGGNSSTSRPVLIVDANQRATIGWPAGVRPPAGPAVELCFSNGLYAVSADTAPRLLLLQDDRFEVSIEWEDFPRSAGQGRGVQLTGDSGYFWFFGENNIEVVVKVLDGRAVNGHFWVFYASLTDVAYHLKVRDRATGHEKTYAKVGGRLASRADTLAFPAGAPPAASAPLFAPPAMPATSETLATLETWAASEKSHTPPAEAVGPCAPASVPGPRRVGLCLGERFEVEMDWQAVGTHGAGQGVQLTADSGYLWFFGPNNIEVMVKVLDGRAVNGHFWVFLGGLSDVDYTIAVRDTVTGAVRTYVNPVGRLVSLADTAAF
ncbi:MAG TPA: hypothetical protein VEL74_00825 [Thermoanaerobaculia bacterium]|nr:hypothetical protein [Thermoanaerobaculia bacterium]